MPVIQRRLADPSKSIYFRQRQCGWHLDAASQDASNGHIFQRRLSNLLLPVWDYLPDHHVHRNYFQIITFYVGGRALPDREVQWLDHWTARAGCPDDCYSAFQWRA